jgi:hypothetical protein
VSDPVFRHPALLLIFVLCAACSPAVTTTATARPAHTPTLQPTAIPSTSTPTPTQSPTPDERTFDYKVIHQDGSFMIREAFLGTDAIWKDDYKMPPRIENTVQSLGLGRDMACDQQSESNTPCSQTLELGLANGATDVYTFRLANLNGGTGVLFKNGRLLWSGLTNGGPSFAVLSSKRIGDEIAFEYAKSNWGSNQKPFWMTYSILLTRGSTVVLIPSGFAPNSIDGKLVYFKIKGRAQILVFDGREVGATYDEVFNQPCCWHGPPIQIAVNEKMIDFFAQKGRDWYHIQAGYLNGE